MSGDAFVELKMWCSSTVPDRRVFSPDHHALWSSSAWAGSTQRERRSTGGINKLPDDESQVQWGSEWELDHSTENLCLLKLVNPSEKKQPLVNYLCMLEKLTAKSSDNDLWKWCCFQTKANETVLYPPKCLGKYESTSDERHKEYEFIPKQQKSSETRCFTLLTLLRVPKKVGSFIYSLKKILKSDCKSDTMITTEKSVVNFLKSSWYFLNL